MEKKKTKPAKKAAKRTRKTPTKTAVVKKAKSILKPKKKFVLGGKNKTEQRRQDLLKLVRIGKTGIDQIRREYELRGWHVSDRTINYDLAAVRAALKESLDREIDTVRAELVAQFDHDALQLQYIADDAKDASWHAAVQALGKKHDIQVDKAKLLGAWVEKQEHTGAMANLNVNADLSSEDVSGVVEALRRAKLSVDDVEGLLTDDAE